MRRLLFALLLIVALTPFGAHDAAAQNFVHAVGTQLYRGNAAAMPLRPVGAEMRDALRLAQRGKAGNRKRIAAELDTLRGRGIRLVACSVDAADAQQLSALDFLLRELERRDMLAVLTLVDTAFVAPADFASDSARAALATRIGALAARRSSVTKRSYAASPAIFAWQLFGSLRPYVSVVPLPALKDWAALVADEIRKADANHLVGLGGEGLAAFAHEGGGQTPLSKRDDSELAFEALQGLDCFSFVSMQLRPVEWGWTNIGSLHSALRHVFLASDDYLAAHERLAMRLGRPLVVGAFSYSRDHGHTQPGSLTAARDAYFSYVLTKLLESGQNAGALSSAMFSHWAGEPTADAAREVARTAVFPSDSSTLQVLSVFLEKINAPLSPAE